MPYNIATFYMPYFAPTFLFKQMFCSLLVHVQGS